MKKLNEETKIKNLIGKKFYCPVGDVVPPDLQHFLNYHCYTKKQLYDKNGDFDHPELKKGDCVLELTITTKKKI
jgi:hypothetical protein